jgi:hypothetical protein
VSSVDDREFERYLRHDDPLSRAYAELKSERPSPALDQAVLARARDALKSAAPARRVYIRRWTAITALAATVVLSFGLVMRLALEPESQVPTASPTAIDAISTQPAAPATAAKEAARAGPPASVPAAGTARDRAASPSSIEEQRPQIEAELREAAEQAPAVPEPVPTTAAPNAQYVQQPASAESDLRSGTPAAQPMRQEQAAERSSPERGLTRLKKAQEAPAVAGASSAASVGERNFADHAEPADEEFKRTPEAWLAEIERLRAAGETEAADRELVQFNKTYPDYYDKLQPVDPAPERK